MDTTFGQWMSTVMLYYVKKISYYAVQKEKLYFLMKYSVQGKPFILWLCNYLNNIVIVEFKTLVTNYTKVIGRAKTNETMLFCQFVMNKGKVIKFPSILLYL